MKEWLPHAIIALTALSAAALSADLTGDRDARQDLYERVYSPQGNETVQPPSTALFAWASVGFAAIGGFYAGVSVVHFRIWLRVVKR